MQRRQRERRACRGDEGQRESREEKRQNEVRIPRVIETPPAVTRAQRDRAERNAGAEFWNHPEQSVGMKCSDHPDSGAVGTSISSDGNVPDEPKIELGSDQLIRQLTRHAPNVPTGVRISPNNHKHSDMGETRLSFTLSLLPPSSPLLPPPTKSLSAAAPSLFLSLWSAGSLCRCPPSLARPARRPTRSTFGRHFLLVDEPADWILDLALGGWG